MISPETTEKPQLSMQAQLCCAVLRINNSALNEHLVRWAFSDSTTIQQLFSALRYICDNGTNTHLHNNVDSAFRLASKGALLLLQNDGGLLPFGGSWLLLDSHASRFEYVTKKHSPLRAGSIYLLGSLCSEVMSAFLKRTIIFELLWSELTKFYQFGGFSKWAERCRRIVYCVLDSAIRNQSAHLGTSSTGARYALTLLGGAIQFLLCPNMTARPFFDFLVQRTLTEQCASDIARVDQMLLEMAQKAIVPKLFLISMPLCSPISIYIRKEWQQVRRMLDDMHLAPGITLIKVEAFLTPLPNVMGRVFRTRSMSSPKQGFDQGVLQSLCVSQQRQQMPLGRREGMHRNLSQVAGVENQLLEARLHELLVLLQSAHSSITTLSLLGSDNDSFALVELANSLRLIIDVQESILHTLLSGPLIAFEEFVVNCSIFKIHRDAILHHKDAIIAWSSSFNSAKGDKSIVDLVLLPFTRVLPCIIELCCKSTSLRIVHEKLVSFYCSLELFTHLRVLVLEALFEPAPVVVVPEALVQLFEDEIFVITIEPLCVSLSLAVLVVVNDTIICGIYRHPHTQAQDLSCKTFLFPTNPMYTLCFKAIIDKETMLQDIVNSYGTIVECF
jgi:hypothetical protein